MEPDPPEGPMAAMAPAAHHGQACSRPWPLLLFLLLLLLLLWGPDSAQGAASEPGRWTVTAHSNRSDNIFVFSKTMFNGTRIILSATEICEEGTTFNITWYLRSSRCHDEVNIDEQKAAEYLRFPSLQQSEEGSGFFVFFTLGPINCSSLGHKLLSFFPPSQLKHPEFLHPKPLILPQQPQQQVAGPQQPGTPGPEPEPPAPSEARGARGGKDEASRVGLAAAAQTWEDGPYVFVLRIGAASVRSPASYWAVTVDVQMKHPRHLYISASEWPLMAFYMAMCVVYVCYAALWLLLLAWHWRDLLRIQLWVGGVVLLGMVEKAVAYAQLQALQTHGTAVPAAVVFAEVLCAVKRTLARVLVIIASLGYGIVKPRLGVLLNRVVGVGLLYLAFSLLEGLLRVQTERNAPAVTLGCEVVLAFVDSCIVWWILVSLVQTMKLLRLRRNVVKLSLYRHFTNTLIFAVIASVIFIIWTTKTFRLAKCQSDWRELWIDDAFWRFLFSLVLLVIMFLWRPSANSQRYAFMPLVEDGSEEEEEEEEEHTVHAAFGTKMRSSKNEINGILKPNRADEDLKWVEENIPSSMADAMLPPLLDSDEETVTTQFEMSKME
ncbi:transmembrane protein 87A-like isoform X2 [Tachyglossus aculeatus]|uniref:transmembrane protein 87A-like isoform X2 n=1 Tax=Tachyglossus aculeatus TaxID=9261 RepID=UPI0018F2DF88|nr:transmembrane protein 87A-like isoform X2 [Tachyglossus aculeatus]